MQSDVVTKHPEIMHGTACLAGTRVPVKSFFEHLEYGRNVEYFLTQFPIVSKKQAIAVLKAAADWAETNAREVNY